MKKQGQNVVLSRREVVRAAGFGLVAAPFIVNSRAFGSNNRIRVGQIGFGRIAQGHDMPGVIKSDLADFVAVCDLDSKRLADGVKLVEKAYTDKGYSKPPAIR